MHGVVVVDKPAGPTSHDVVNRLRRVFGVRRIGHAGTLDPLATGVLVVCVGAATRIAEYLAAGRKAYTAAVAFGLRTDTQDSSGSVVGSSDASHITYEQVAGALAPFRGTISQVPPMVSAVHHEGRRLYELARNGVEVERDARPVDVYDLELTDFTPGSPAMATLHVECGSGTYIRTLAADIGDALGVGGVMTALRRTRAGAFTLTDARTLEALQIAEAPQSMLRSVAESLADWPRSVLSADLLDRVRHGQAVPEDRAPETGTHRGDGLLLLLSTDGEAVAVARHEGCALQPVKVLPADA
jgi:tRNA pseudouridine55 synthase